MLFMGLNAVAEAASTLTLEQSVHFTSSDGNNWRRHGRYMLNAGTQTYVEVSSANGTAGADAVQCIRVP